MAIITQRAARVVKTISGASPEIGVYPEAASQAFKAGEFVYLASGKVTECASDSVTILGMACADATGTTDADCFVYVANADTIFEANVYHSTPGSAVTAVTDVGVNYALINDGAGKSYVDIEDTGHDAFVVTAISEKDNVGDQYGRVLFRVLDAAAQLVAGS